MKKIPIFLVFIFLSAVQLFAQFEKVWEKYNDGPVLDAVFSADGRFVYIGQGPQVRKIDAVNGDLLSIFDDNGFGDAGEVRDLRISKDGKYLGDCTKYILSIWDAQQEKKVKYIPFIGSFDFFQDSRRCILGEVGKLSIYDLETETVTKSLPIDKLPKKIAVSPNGKYFVVASNYEDSFDKKRYDVLTLYDSETMAEIWNIDKKLADESIRSIKFSPDNNLIAWIRWGNTYIYSISENRLIFHLDKTLDLEFLPENYRFFTSASKEPYPKLTLRTFSGEYTEFEAYSSIITIYSNDSVQKVFSAYSGVMALLIDTNLSAIQEPLPFKIFYTENQLNLVFEDGEFLEQIIVSDIEGKILYNNMYQSASSEHLPLYLHTGAYLCRIVTNKGDYTHKLQVTR